MLESSNMRQLKRVKLQHTKWKNWHTAKTPFGKRRKEKEEDKTKMGQRDRKLKR